MSKIIISLDSWQIKSFLECETSFKLAYIENLRKTRIWPDANRYADKGTLGHAIMGIYYTLRALEPKKDRYAHGATTIKILKQNKLVKKFGFDDDFEALVISRFNQYLFKYSV